MKSRWSILVLAMLAFSGATHAQYFGGLVLTPQRSSVFNDETLVPLAGLYTPVSPLDAGAGRYGLRLDLRSSPLFPAGGRYFGAGLPGSSPKSQALDIGVSGALPLFDRFSLVGRLSMLRMKPDAVPGADWLSPYGYKSNRMSLGVQYDISRSLGLRFEVARQRFLQGTGLDGETDHNFSFGVAFRF